MLDIVFDMYVHIFRQCWHMYMIQAHCTAPHCTTPHHILTLTSIYTRVTRIFSANSENYSKYSRGTVSGPSFICSLVRSFLYPFIESWSWCTEDVPFSPFTFALSLSRSHSSRLKCLQAAMHIYVSVKLSTNPKIPEYLCVIIIAFLSVKAKKCIGSVEITEAQCINSANKMNVVEKKVLRNTLAFSMHAQRDRN